MFGMRTSNPSIFNEAFSIHATNLGTEMNRVHLPKALHGAFSQIVEKNWSRGSRVCANMMVFANIEAGGPTCEQI